MSEFYCDLAGRAWDRETVRFWAGGVEHEPLCPHCLVERADYETDGGHLPECPNCGSNAKPIVARQGIARCSKDPSNQLDGAAPEEPT